MLVSETHIENLIRFRTTLEENNPKKKTSITRTVFIEPIEEYHDDLPQLSVSFERAPSIHELLEVTARLPIKKQVIILANLLTISGFTQEEIATSIGISHKYFRNVLLDFRKGRDRSI